MVLVMRPSSKLASEPFFTLKYPLPPGRFPCGDPPLEFVRSPVHSSATCLFDRHMIMRCRRMCECEKESERKSNNNNRTHSNVSSRSNCCCYLTTCTSCVHSERIYIVPAVIASYYCCDCVTICYCTVARYKHWQIVLFSRTTDDY